MSSLLTETILDRAADNSLSIEIAPTVTGGGYFDYKAGLTRLAF